MTDSYDRNAWRRHFADIVVSGDHAEVHAATEAAFAAANAGADWRSANAAGKAAARQFRGGDEGITTAHARYAEPPRGRSWAELAGPLFAAPGRWGWETARPVVPAPPPPVAATRPRPMWIEPPRPDTSGMLAGRSSAVSKAIRTSAIAAVLVVGYVAFLPTIEQQLRKVARSSGQAQSVTTVYYVVVIVLGALLALAVLRALGQVRRATTAVRKFEQPYLTLRAAEQQRHQQALAEWERYTRQYNAEAAAAAQEAERAANGPQWYPVHPLGDPARIDVCGGDLGRNGWAGLLVTVGVSLLASGSRITVLDLTGEDVGGGLANVAAARGLRVRRADFGDGPCPGLLESISRAEVAECLAYVMNPRQDKETEVRQERALVLDVLRRVVGGLDGQLTFARLAAGVRVLRQGSGDELLSPDEIGALAVQIGDIDQNEWTTRQLRFLAGRLDLLHEIARESHLHSPLWTNDAVSVLRTPGGRDDRKELLDGMLVELAQRAMEGQRRLGGVLVVAGADHLGAKTLETLSGHARRASVRLMLMVDHPQGDLERLVGTGGVVCVMKMYNHRDAAVAAEFIGRGHRFVLSQVTRQAGRTFTDSGGDSFAANTSQGTTDKPRQGLKAAGTDRTESRGHAWTGTRNWSSADNVGTSTSTSRVYEFTVEPQEILGLPYTAFLLVDNSGNGRRVVMADANPGLCLVPRVATAPRAV